MKGRLKTWLRSHGMITLSPTSTVPSLVNRIVGDELRGSWWSHPKGNVIYNCYQALLDEPDVLSMKLVDGKVTLVHAGLWPILLAVVLDVKWKEQATRTLAKEARALLSRVEKQGTVRLDDIAHAWPGGRKALKKTKEALESKGLVLTRDLHTESGTHTTVLESWQAFQERTGVQIEKALDYQSAMRRLQDIAKGARLTVVSLKS
jgi:hypothetical protein